MELNNNYDKNFVPIADKINLFLMQDLHEKYKNIINSQQKTAEQISEKENQKNQFIENKTKELERKTIELNELLKKSLNTFEDSDDDTSSTVSPSISPRNDIQKTIHVEQDINELNNQLINNEIKTITMKETQTNTNITQPNEETDALTTLVEEIMSKKTEQDDDYYHVEHEQYAEIDWQVINILDITN